MAMEYRSKEARRAIIARFETADMPAREFCRREGLNYWTFCGWRRRMRDESLPQQLVEVGPVVAAGEGGRVLVRASLGETTVELECASEERELAAVLRALRGATC